MEIEIRVREGENVAMVSERGNSADIIWGILCPAYNKV